jgi:hypothetical protein
MIFCIIQQKSKRGSIYVVNVNKFCFVTFLYVFKTIQNVKYTFKHACDAKMNVN